MTRLRKVVLLGALALLAGLSSQVSTQAPLTVGGFVKVSERRVTRTVTEFVYRATLTNGGGALAGATATATSLVPATVIVDGSLTFGPIGPGGSVVSTDTFTFRQDKSKAFKWANLSWLAVGSPANVAPVAVAGADQSATLGQTVTLNGSASSDGNGDPLTYAWTLTTVPAGSAAVLSNATAVQPTFVIDLPGTYTAQLVVHDGTVASAPDTVTISTLNTAPTANAGPDQATFVGQTVTLNGSGSSDADGNPLTYAWSVVSRPAGSAATPAPPTAVGPTVVIDRAGTYVFALVVHDGTVASAPDTVTISTVNTAPVAAAGPDQGASLGQTATLNGSGSTDADGDPLMYAWSLTALPAGSAAVLSNATAVQPTFVIDLPGTYVAQLVVHDGTVASAPDTVVVSTLNTPPVAQAGPDQAVVAGGAVLLDGSASSDADGDPLTFAWSLTSVPAGSTAVLAGAATAGPSFVADLPGNYIAQLVVHDGTVASAPDTVTISTSNVAPVANAGPDQIGVPLAQVAVLDGSLSTDADGHALSYGWSFTSRPAGSTAVLNGATTVAPTFTPDVAGDYIVQLQVSDGFVTSPIDTVLIRANGPPDAQAGPDQAVTVGAVVNLNGSGLTDPEGQPLTYGWVLTVRPAGSAAVLAGAGTATPSFTADVLGSYTATLTVTDDRGATDTDTVTITAGALSVVTIEATDAAASETVPDPGAFTVTRTGNLAVPLTVHYTVGGSATPVNDYAALSGAVTIAATQATALIPVLPVNDPDVEGVGETVDVTVAPNAAYTVGAPSTATVTIADNDVALPLVSVVATDAAASELGPDLGVFTVTRTGSTIAPLSVSYTMSGSAANGTDYTLLSGTVMIPATQASATVTVTPVTDALVEGLDTATLTITDTAAYDLGAPSAATVNIADAPVVTVVATDATAAETGGNTGLWTLTRTGDTSGVLGVDLTYSGTATINTDYTNPGQSVNFAAGQATTTVTLFATPDAVIDPGETAILTAVAGINYVVGAPASGTVTITDTTPTVTVVATDALAAETGGNTGLWTLTRTGDTSGVLGVDLTYSGTATINTDFANPGQSVNFAAGQATTTVTLFATPDAVIDPGETAILTVAAGINYVVGAPASGTVTITDTTPTVTVVATDNVAAETGGNTGLWTLTRTGDTSGVLGVDLTYSGTATINTDFANPGQSVNFAAGQATTTVTLFATPDAVIDPGETAILTVAAGINYIVGAPASGTVTITDTTPTVTVVATDNLAAETGGNTGLYTLTRTGSTASVLTVNLSYGGTAAINADYTNPGQSVNFAAGQATTAVTLTAVNDGSPESDETAILTIAAGSDYIVGAPGSATVTITDQVLSTMSIGLVNTTVVGVTRTAALRVTLTQPAGAGGVLVSFGSSVPATLTFSGPTTVTVAQGQTTGDVTLLGVAFGSATITATAPGYAQATAVVPVTLNLISTPANLGVGLGQTVSLPVTIGPSVAPAGGIVVDVVSANSAIIEVLTAQVTIPQGQLSANAIVRGAGAGSASVTASSAGYSPSSTTVSATGILNITQAALAFNNGFTPPNGTVQLESAGGPTPAPSNLTVSLSSANTACVTVPATIVIPAGQTTAPFQPAYGGTASLPCTTGVTASLAGLTSDTIQVTVNPQPGITMNANRTVGASLQVGESASLGTSQHAGVVVTISSDTPGRVLVSPTATTAGTPSFTLNLANGQSAIPYYVQGVEGASGNATVTISAPGFTNATGVVSVVPIGIEVHGVPATITTLSANDGSIYAQIGIPNAAGTGLAAVQNLRAGGPAFIFTLTNSNAAVAQLYSDQPVTTGQVVTKPIQPNIYYNQAAIGGTTYGIAFDPLGTGSTTVTVTGPPGVATMTTTGVRTVTVTGPDITVPATQAVGAGLQLPANATLGASQHGGVTATITSSDPTRVRVSPNATTAGAASVVLPIANGATAVSFHVQGMENTTGSATITIDTGGVFPSSSYTVNVVPTGIEVHGLPATTTTLSTTDTSVYAQVGIPNALGTALGTVQNVRAGGPVFTFTLTNSNAAVAQLYSDQPVTTGQVVTKPINPNIYYNVIAIAGTSYGLGFDPIGGGSTTVTVTGPPGVVTMTTSGVRTVTVTSPGITMPGALTVGAWLQVSTQATLGAAQHGGVTATITSSNPALVRVSPDATTAGAVSIVRPIANGATAVAYYVQGVEGTSGSATITVDTGGVFPTSNHVVNVVPIGIEVIGLPATTTSLSASDTSFYAQIGIPNPAGTGLATVQNLRGGGPLFTFTLSNSNAAVAQLYSDEPVVTGQVVTKPIRSNVYYNVSVLAGTSYGLAFDPLSAGSTTVTITGPPGVATMTTNGVRTIGVSAPGITVAATDTVGAGLQVNNHSATLGGSQHGGVTMTITSSAPGLVRVAPNGTIAGTPSLNIPLANGQVTGSFTVQALENVTGSAVLTVSAPGFIDAQMTVTVVPSGIEILGLPVSIGAAAVEDTNWYVQVGVPNASNTALQSVQNVRAGGPGFVVTLTNSNAVAARLRSDQPALTGQVVTKPVQPNIYYTQQVAAGTTYGLAFDPLAAGSTTVTATGGAGVLTMSTNGVRTVTVTP